MELNNAQKQAVEYLDGPLLVLAGPGTGKTQLLSSKVAYILENTDTNPENILCITFTDNGAANMRNRLASIVGKAAHSINISTYHAFGLDILYRYQQYSPDLNRKLENAISDVAGYKIIKNILANLPATDILKHDNIKDILATISEAKAARLNAKSLTKIATHNTDQSASLNAEIAPVLATTTGKTMKLEQALETVYYPIADLIAPLTSNQPIAGNVYPLANDLLYSLKKAIDEANNPDKPSVSPLTKWRNAYFELDANGDWRLSNIVANKKLTSIALVMESYQQYLIEHHLYDFNDMIELAIETLKNDQGFRLSLSEKIQYILLDEFQDTNPAQFELIRLLTDYEKPNIMAVGDDDQAIFAFQGANASNLLDFQNHYNAKVIVLTENYRSTQDILDFSRHIANQLSDSFAKSRNINKQLQAKGFEEYLQSNSLKKQSSHEVTRHNFVASADEYAWVANEINNLIESGIKQTEIAVIAPKHKYLIPFLPHLKKYPNINIAYEKRDNIFENPAINQLLKLSKFIYELAAEKPTSHFVLEILAFPFWKISPATAIEAAHTAKKSKTSILKVVANSEDEKLKNIADFISALVVISYDTPLELFLDYLIGTATLENHQTSPFLIYYQNHQTDVEIYELYNHLHILKSALSNYSENPSPKLQDLITFVDDYADANYPLTNTSPYQSSPNAIQLMSGHKSKGLEFKYVFLISTDDRAWGNQKGNNNTLSLPKNLTHIRHTGATEDECIRLFFVAATRAKTNLIMTNSGFNFDGKPNKSLQYLNETEQNNELISPYLPEKSQKIIKHEETKTETSLDDTLKTHWSAIYQKPDTNLRNLLLKHVESYRLTATDLTSFINLKYGGPQAFYQRRILNAPDEPISPQLMLGNLVHAVFEKITKEHIDDDAAFEYFKERLDEEALPVKDREELAEKGLHILEISLQKFGKLLRAPTAMSEVDFRKHHLQIDNLQITGKIDHIQVDKNQKTIKIYDFKTGNHHAPGKKVGWQGDLSLFNYSLQLEFYKLLLKTSSEYRNYQITEGHILFVNPDHEGQVYDEVYEFTDESAEKFLNLAKAIYYQIKTLDFLDNNELNLPPNEEVSMKQIREFIEKIKDAEH